MSTDRETVRVVRSWLEEGATALPDRVLDTVLDQLPATPQRRPWGLVRRFAQMNRSLQAALAAAVVVVVVGIIGLNLVGGGATGGQGRPSLIPTAGSTPTPTASPMAPPLGSTPLPLAAGQYKAAALGLNLGFTVPTGWQGNIGGPYFMAVERAASDHGGIYFNVLGNVFADPCQLDKGLASPAIGPSVDDLLTSLTHLGGVTTTTPIDTTFAGYPAKSLTLTPSAGAEKCSGGVLNLWQLPLGAIAEMSPAQRDRIWLLTVNGTRLVIEVDEFAGQGSATAAEIQAVLDSVTIMP